MCDFFFAHGYSKQDIGIIPLTTKILSCVLRTWSSENRPIWNFWCRRWVVTVGRRSRRKKRRWNSVEKDEALPSRSYPPQRWPSTRVFPELRWYCCCSCCTNYYCCCCCCYCCYFDSETNIWKSCSERMKLVQIYPALTQAYRKTAHDVYEFSGASCHNFVW